MRDQSIEGFLDDLAARTPAPDGGAAACLHAAQAAALLAMVARYTDGDRHAEHSEIVGTALAEAEILRLRALELAEQDVHTPREVGAARSHPRSTRAEKAARRDAIQHALSGAARPSVDTIALVAEILALAETLLSVGDRDVIADVAAAAEAARAAAAIARVNVEVDLANIEDLGAQVALREEVAGVDDLLDRAHRLTETVRATIR
ncbi:cyclodeaminase/cyclohydrolase family protein [Actinoalloteichus hymeniacidonis]|uniref:Methenyl tetrahydrofolate cyclohydrolase n=1 Tax=Actinoalloteichus hymeniacidonis TaxID=340345 RepID=A0AAC9HQZ7_9PSEU|nr:cyclodeaminase/cyclohydrolase family protein [Actinoalloteichus hymeniacidonis]AOS63626.1 methenyl tetrahydrofolate cyclohydrolase [Actinoalloteichus hymeniacidonis]MBB5908326.1 formiminotetrahydrofolate cyclodeaminase [Actinoalloteichus hymeniacidonis]